MGCKHVYAWTHNVINGNVVLKCIKCGKTVVLSKSSNNLEKYLNQGD